MMSPECLQAEVMNESGVSKKVPHGKPGRSGPPGNKNALKHGYYSLVKMVRSRNGALDRRTILGKMLMETVRQLEADLGGDLSEAQRMLVADVALDTLLLQAVNRKIASVLPIRKGKVHSAFQLRAQLIAQRREHLKLLFPAGLTRKVPTLNEIKQEILAKRQKEGAEGALSKQLRQESKPGLPAVPQVQRAAGISGRGETDLEREAEAG
jgi:hypothetical protein